MTNSSCRLCGYNSADLVDIYSEQGMVAEYERKIGRYLYLLVTPDDDLPKEICWMCTQQLDSFHRFHEKINEIQQKLLKDRYPQFVIQIHHKYEDDIIIDHIVEDALPVDSALQSLPDTAADDSTIRLIPSNETDDSFLVVKSASVATNVQSNCEKSHEITDNSTDVEIFEIRKSTRKKRPAKHTDQEEPNSPDEESDDEIQLKQKRTTARRRYTKQTVAVPDTEAGSTKQECPVLSKSTEKASRIIAEKSVQKKEKITKGLEERSEGESGDEFPARDSDNEEWPAAETMEKFPTTIIRNGLVTVKGKELMSMINSFYNLQCDVCKDKTTRFKALPELFDHCKSIHQQEGYVLCCQSKFTRYPAIIMHMARHIQPEAFKCDICGYMVTRPRFLDTHRQTHLPEDQKPYACSFCPKRFCWKRALQVHLNLHKAPEERAVYMCPFCGKTYDTPGGLSAHKKNVHIDPRTTKDSHVCEMCANTFATSSGLKEHMTTIHQPRGKGQLQCPECSKWLMNSRCLKVHMQLHSKEEFECDRCDYKTKKNSLLKRHKITHHQEERPFSCDKCSSTFKHKRALTVHVGTKHTEEKTSYKCNFCDRTFASSTNFYTHRKNRHPNELAAMKEQMEQEKKLQRIKAGIEPDDIPASHESTITTNPDGTHIITISSGKYGISESINTMIVLDIADGPVEVQEENE